MSFNVLVTHARDTGVLRWDYRRQGCVAMLRHCSPDIVGLQECREGQFKDLIIALPEYDGVMIPSAQKNFGTCVFFKKDRFILKDRGWQWFNGNPEEPSPAWPGICDDPTYRTFIWADLLMKENNLTIHVYSTHFPRNYNKDHPNDEARRLCAEAIVSHASKRAMENEPVIVAGDLNCSVSREKGSLRPFFDWMKNSWEDTPETARDNYRAHNSFKESAPVEGVANSVDYIFYRNLTSLAYRTVVEPYEGVRFISDHYPILFTAIVYAH